MIRFIRVCIAEMLIDWAIRVMPKGREQELLAAAAIHYFKAVIKEPE